jgi:hypothetical protein
MGISRYHDSAYTRMFLFSERIERCQLNIIMWVRYMCEPHVYHMTVKQHTSKIYTVFITVQFCVRRPHLPAYTTKKRSKSLHSYNELWFLCFLIGNKSIWWMPRLEKATKDVEVCDKLRGGDKQPLIRRFPNGGTPLSS